MAQGTSVQNFMLVSQFARFLGEPLPLGGAAGLTAACRRTRFLVAAVSLDAVKLHWKHSMTPSEP